MKLNKPSLLACVLGATILITGCDIPRKVGTKNLVIEKLEPYTLEGLITGKKLYCLPWGLGTLPILKNVEEYFGLNSEVMPIDIAVVTVPYNDPNLLKDFNTIMGDRWAWMLPKNKNAVYPPRRHITNNHLLSSNQTINEQIRSLKKGQQIKIRGHLVKVTYPNGAQSVSSQTRDDEGFTPVWKRGTPGVAGGSCEVILVESVEIKSPNSPDLYGKGQSIVPIPKK
jgi:hypothetical protein